MKPRLTLLFALSAGVLALDLWTKRWATQALAGAPPMNVIGELVRFTYVRNAGVAFGLGAGFPFPYYLFSIAAVVAILVLFARGRVHGFGRRVALALILGGALGNLVDRLSTGLVVDFIDIGLGRWHWPVFNVADSAVSIGVVMFAFTWPRHEPDANAAGTPASPDAGGERDAGAGPLGSVAGERGAAGSLPGRGADGPLS